MIALWSWQRAFRLRWAWITPFCRWLWKGSLTCLWSFNEWGPDLDRLQGSYNETHFLSVMPAFSFESPKLCLLFKINKQKMVFIILFNYRFLLYRNRFFRVKSNCTTFNKMFHFAVKERERLLFLLMFRVAGYGIY